MLRNLYADGLESGYHQEDFLKKYPKNGYGGLFGTSLNGYI